MAETFTSAEFEEEASTLKTFKEWNEGVRPSWRVFAALNIAATVMRPGVIEGVVEKWDDRTDYPRRDLVAAIRKALTDG